jgi:hypothetical protein
MKRKHSIETPVCPLERLVIISYTTSFSFALERIGPLAAIIIVLYLFILYLFALPNIPKNLFASIYSESLIKTACQHLLFLIGFDTLIYRKYYDTPPILVGHQPPAISYVGAPRNWSPAARFIGCRPTQHQLANHWPLPSKSRAPTREEG